MLALLVHSLEASLEKPMAQIGDREMFLLDGVVILIPCNTDWGI